MIIDKFRGLNNILSESQRKLNFLTQAENVDITDTFGFRLRKGVSKVIAGGGHSLWSDNNICLFRQGTSLKQYYPDNSVVTLRNDLSADPLPMSYLSLLGKVYYSDGRDKGIIEEGVSRSWGLAVPPMPIVSTIAGSLTKGKYGIVTTYIRNDGQESGASSVAEVELTDNSHALRVFTEPSSDETVSRITIYVTTPNGTEFTRYAEVQNTINNVDITSTANLGYRLETQYLSALPAGIMLTFYYGRIFVVDNYTLWYTEPFSYELCNRAKNFIAFDLPINMLIAADDGLWVGTEKETLFLEGHTPPFKVAKLIPYGVVNGRWISDIPAEMLSGGNIKGKVAAWQSTQGICIGGTGGLFSNITEKNFAFPLSLGGFGVFRENNEINQIIMFLKDITENTELYRAFVTESRGTFPMFSGIGTGG